MTEQTLACIVVYFPKSLPGIPLSKIVAPATQLTIELFNQCRNWLEAHFRACHLPQLGSFAGQGLFRNRFSQSVFLPSYINVPSAGSLGSILFPGLLSYYGPLRLPTRPPAGYLFPADVDTTWSPSRVSQVPPPIFPRALSPITPGGPMAACAHCFTIGNGLHHNPEGWSRSTCVTRPNRVHLRYGSRVRSAGLRLHRLLRAPPTPLPAERAINRVPTLQGTRSARLILAHQIALIFHLAMRMPPFP